MKGLPKKSNIEMALNLFLLLAFLVFIGGASAKLAAQDNSAPNNSSADKALNLKERELAVEEAKKNGQKDYSYSSGFMPGIGFSGGTQ